MLLAKDRARFSKESNDCSRLSYFEEPPKIKLKELPAHLEDAYIQGNSDLPEIIPAHPSTNDKEILLRVLKEQQKAIEWSITNIKGISPSYCTHNILMKSNFKPVVQPLRRLKQQVTDVVRKEISKPLDSRLIYPIFDSPWVSPIHVVPKKEGMTRVANKKNELISTRIITKRRVYLNYRKLKQYNLEDNKARRERLARLHELYKLRLNAYDNARRYKERTKKWHDSRHKSSRSFEKGEKVLLYSSRPHSFPGKLKTRWSRHFVVAKVYPFDAVDLEGHFGTTFKVNGSLLKRYHGVLRDSKHDLEMDIT